MGQKVKQANKMLRASQTKSTVSNSAPDGNKKTQSNTT